MKKLFVLGMGLCVAIAVTSCKSSESSYKKAYEKAKQQELAETKQPTEEVVPVVVSAPVQQAPAQQARTNPGDARQEKVSVVSGSGLQDFSVVCGSFGVKANADNLKAFLDREGYTALVVFNADKAMYRVIVGTYADYDSAARARDEFKAKYPSRNDFQGSWLLYRL